MEAALSLEPFLELTGTLARDLQVGSCAGRAGPRCALLLSQCGWARQPAPTARRSLYPQAEFLPYLPRLCAALADLVDEGGWGG